MTEPAIIPRRFGRTKATDSWLGLGIYAVEDAARFADVAPRDARRWLGGYCRRTPSQTEDTRYAPLWQVRFPAIDGVLGLSFADLVQLQVVVQLRRKLEVPLQTLRKAVRHAQDVMKMDYPPARRDFQTDGKTLFLEVLTGSDDPSERHLDDLMTGQFVMRLVLAPLFRQLDFGLDRGAERWWPLGKSRKVVVDPAFAMGQPVTSVSYVPTRVLAEAVHALGSVDAASRWYEVSAAEVRDAMSFEHRGSRAAA